MAEDQALAHLQAAGLTLAVRNYRTPGRGGGEIDLVMRDRDGTLVFVEVRSRASSAFGGAGGSISQTKQQRIIFAARHYLMRLPSPPPCRFDVVLVEDSVQSGSRPPSTRSSGAVAMRQRQGAQAAKALCAATVCYKSYNTRRLSSGPYA